MNKAEASSEQTEGRCFFILSCARSGSTSLAQILDTAKNTLCATEPTPNLNYETREMMEGRLRNPRHVLESTVVKRVRYNLNKVEIYGEKNVTYGPFIDLLYKLLGCKFVFIKRDGRDVVRSLNDWHERIFGTIYRECIELGNLSPLAVTNAAGLPVHLDTSDYSRPRPLPGTPFYNDWENFSRVEMCAYYWSYINDLYLNNLEKIPPEAWVDIDYTSPGADDILRVGEFLGLKGLSRRRIQTMLEKKINSLRDRIGEEKTFPEWQNWDSGLRRRFDRIAANTMQYMGYYSSDCLNWRPSNYGLFLFTRDPENILEWYTWMYNGRYKIHKDLVDWAHKMDENGEYIQSIADFGCGLGIGYNEDFADKHYVGVDISPINIEWCNKNRNNPKHGYVNIDFISEPIDEKFDLVFSSGTIDNTYDVDAFLRSMVFNSKKWIYLTCYRGWFPHLDEHQYNWHEEHGCFYNDLSPQRIRETLVSLGCRDIRIEPVKTNNQEIEYETLIIARVLEGSKLA